MLNIRSALQNITSTLQILKKQWQNLQVDFREKQFELMKKINLREMREMIQGLHSEAKAAMEWVEANPWQQFKG